MRNTNGFLVGRKAHCPVCGKELKKGQEIKQAEYHKKCWERKRKPRTWELFTKADR